MTSAAVDMADYLAANGIGTIGTNLFVAAEPAQPANCVTLYDTGGPQSDPDANFFRPTIQARVRNVDYRAACSLMKQIHDALADVYTGVQVDDWYYFGAGSTNEPEPIGKDDQDRFLLTQNFQIMRERASN